MLSKNRHFFRKRRLTLGFGLIFGGILLAVGIVGVMDYVSVKNEGAAVPEPVVVTDDSATPSEKKPDMTQEYTVPAQYPRAIKIPSIGVETYIQQVGVTKANEMATPTNVHFTGWYVNGVTPGEPGLSIINGHVGGRYSPGVFANLKNTKTGDTIEIQMGDLSWRNFEIVSVATYSIEQSGAALFKDNPEITNELHLITCEGNYNQKSDTYDKRLIVVARLQGTRRS